ncbi:MAG: hypothetical protein AAF993_00860 [Pseudomonadota bacterium]
MDNGSPQAALMVQRILAGIFIGLGGWALFFPTSVEQMVIRPEFRMNALTVAIFIGCFGAQAILCGTVIWFSRFTARTFLIFGLVGSLPFFAFNYYFVFVQPVFTHWMLLDFVGNTGILLCGLIGWQICRQAALSKPAASLADP